MTHFIIVNCLCPCQGLWERILGNSAVIQRNNLLHTNIVACLTLKISFFNPMYFDFDVLWMDTSSMSENVHFWYAQFHFIFLGVGGCITIYI